MQRSFADDIQIGRKRMSGKRNQRRFDGRKLVPIQVNARDLNSFYIDQK